MDQPFTQRELVEHFDDVTNRLARIEAQTTKTNGRVTFQEKWQYAMSMCIALTYFVILPLVVYTYISAEANIQSEIATLQSVKDNLSTVIATK